MRRVAEIGCMRTCAFEQTLVFIKWLVQYDHLSVLLLDQ